MTRRRGREPITGADIDRLLAEDADAIDDEALTGTFDDLIQEDRFRDERGTLTVLREDAPVEVDALPLPHPWQGIRRAAVVFNLNFVWDSDEEEWIRDEGNGGGGGALTQIDTGTFNVPDSSGPPNSPFGTGVTTFTEGAFGVLGLADESDLPAGQINFILDDETAESSDTIAWKFGFDPSVDEYFYDIQHELGSNITCRWAILQPTI